MLYVYLTVTENRLAYKILMPTLFKNRQTGGLYFCSCMIPHTPVCKHVRKCTTLHRCNVVYLQHGESE